MGCVISFREYDPQWHIQDAALLWKEVGWLRPGVHENDLHAWLASCSGLISDHAGRPECVAMALSGNLRYLLRDIPLSIVAAVITGYPARCGGLAAKLTTQLLARERIRGALVSSLGMFEQGYYNRLGFGSGCYEHFVSFDPSRIRVNARPRPCVRLERKDLPRLHESRLRRLRRHGSINIENPDFTFWRGVNPAGGFGLGYECDDGTISHHLWLHPDNDRADSFTVSWLAYSNMTQFLELLALIKSLASQWNLATIMEPPGIQMQDVLDHPIRNRIISRNSDYEQNIRSRAWWQCRILDMRGCLKLTALPVDEFRFHLTLSDPIEEFLDRREPWSGESGEYVVTLGPECDIRQGVDRSLPTLACSIGAFTRMWLGALPASGLAVTDDLYGLPELLEKLDRAFALPRPLPDWLF